MSSLRIYFVTIILMLVLLGGVHHYNYQQVEQSLKVFYPLELSLQKTTHYLQHQSSLDFQESPLPGLANQVKSISVSKSLENQLQPTVWIRLKLFIDDLYTSPANLPKAKLALLEKESRELQTELHRANLKIQNDLHPVWINWLGLLFGFGSLTGLFLSHYKEIRKQLLSLTHTLSHEAKKLKAHTAFANQIGSGNFDDSNIKIQDDDTLGLALAQMRDNLKRTTEEDEKRNWITKGMAQFSDLLRENNQSLSELGDGIISNLVRYIGATQGALFLHESDESHKDGSLRMVSCYAYNRKKFFNQRILPGEGVVGQAYIEKAPIFMNDIPKGYNKINSGLGDASPNCIFVVPLLLNKKVYGVIELASFNSLAPYKLKFVKHLCESIASTISTTRNNEYTLKLLHNSQQMTEEMRAQEEELRQNLEEMRCTEEHMKQKELEQDARNKAIDSTLATAEFDMNLKFISTNAIFNDLLKYNRGDLHGKDHREIMPAAKHHSKDYLKFRKELMAGKAQFGEFEHRCNHDDQRFFQSAYAVICDQNNQPIKILMVANDITRARGLFNEVKQQKEEVEHIRLAEKKRSDEEITSLKNLMSDYMIRYKQENHKLQQRITELETKGASKIKATAAVNSTN